MSESLWFYIDSDEQTIGPLEFRDMDVLLRTDSISLSTYAWKDGMDDWHHLGEIPEFIQSVAEDDIELALHMKTDTPALFTLTDEQKVTSIQKSQQLKRAKHKRQKVKKLGKWYTPKLNTNLYISGLPSHITPEELKDFFSKAGVIRIDKFTGLPKIKLYHGEDGELKGDGLVSYAKPESLTIAVTMLDKQEIKQGFPVHLEPVLLTYRLNLTRKETTLQGRR